MSKLKLILMILVVIGAGAGLYLYWQHEGKYPGTDDAYLQGNILSVSPQVAGQIDQVMVVENQLVKAGDQLFTIKNDSYEAAVKAAQARLDMAKQSVDAGSNSVTANQAQVTAAQAALTDATNQFDRTQKLFQAGDVSQASMDQATSARDQATAQLTAAQARVSAAQAQLGGSGSDNASVRAAQANLTMAQIDLTHTTVTAPAAGWISNISLRPGQFVEPGQSLFAIVEDGSWWIDANFKETDIERIRTGQPATISIDMYPGKTLNGTVDSLGAGSGAVFSLVPPQNATGNWVKVTQRFPVRVAISDNDAASAFQLRAGASVTVTVDTTALDEAAQ